MGAGFTKESVGQARVPAVGGWAGGESRRWWAAAQARCLSVCGRTARAAAAAPFPRTRREAVPRRHAPPGDRACQSGRAVLLAPGILSPRKPAVRALWPAASASLAAQGQALDGGLPRQDPAPVGRTGKNRGPRNQAGRPRVQADMRRVCCVIAVAVASVSILAGCSGQPGPHQTVTGLLVRVGGPAPGSPVPLPGTVIARNTAGEQFTTTTGNDGQFQLSLPPGTYRLTGHSPQVKGDGQQLLCRAERTVHVTRRKPVHNIWVICSIK
jgi:hypothetical protein